MPIADKIVCTYKEKKIHRTIFLMIYLYYYYSVDLSVRKASGIQKVHSESNEMNIYCKKQYRTDNHGGI